jgi:hypothetical protein
MERAKHGARSIPFLQFRMTDRFSLYCFAVILLIACLVR